MRYWFVSSESSSFPRSAWERERRRSCGESAWWHVYSQLSTQSVGIPVPTQSVGTRWWFDTRRRSPSPRPSPQRGEGEHAPPTLASFLRSRRLFQLSKLRI